MANMGVERDYKRLPVLYDLGGLHQDPWSGTIKDGDTSDERNIDHSTSGEWKSRAGMTYLGIV